MQLAAGLLSGTAASLTEVASQVGYASDAALSRTFKRLVGVAPALYRQGQHTFTDQRAMSAYAFLQHTRIRENKV